METTEWDPSRGYYQTDARFRQYSNPQDSSRDWWNLMNRPRYQQVIAAPNFEAAARAVGSAGYATDPAYSQKILGLVARTPQQQEFLDQRKRELIAVGAPPHLAELGARKSAIETGWGKSLAGGSNYYGIKAPPGGGQADQTQGAPSMNQNPMSMMQEDPVLAQYGGLLSQLAKRENPEPTFWDRFMENPLTQMGMGILAAPGAGGPLRAVGAGMMAGSQNYERMRQLRQQREDAELERTTGLLGQMAKLRQTYMEPPKVQEFYEGQDTAIQKQWVPGKGWVEVGRGKRWSPNQGMSLYPAAYDEQGRPVSATPLGKTARTEVEKQLLADQAQLGEWEQIEKEFDPQWQSFGEQLDTAWTGWKDKFNRASPKEQADLQKKAGAFANVAATWNKRVKEQAGTAMTEAEQKRIVLELPTVSSTPGEGDSPSQFKGKLKSAHARLKRAVARNQYALKYGIPAESIDVYDDEKFTDTVGEARYQEVKRTLQMTNPNLPDDEVGRQAAEFVKKELGL